jgi:hypothetical protein
MAQLYRVKPRDKKSIYAIYEAYKHLPDGSSRWFTVRELYRWGQGFREMDDPVYAQDDTVIIQPNIGWGCELDDEISIDFDFDERLGDEERAYIEGCWMNGDPEDPDMRMGQAWLYDFSDWMIDDEYIEIIGPVQVDIVDEDQYNVVIQEDAPLPDRPAPQPGFWPFDSIKD